jgi:hypothetical protein
MPKSRRVALLAVLLESIRQRGLDSNQLPLDYEPEWVQLLMPLLNKLTGCSAAESKKPNSSLPLAVPGFSCCPAVVISGYQQRFDFGMAFDFACEGVELSVPANIRPV